jgi:hypothetical protein
MKPSARSLDAPLTLDYENGRAGEQGFSSQRPKEGAPVNTLVESSKPYVPKMPVVKPIRRAAG